MAETAGEFSGLGCAGTLRLCRSWCQLLDLRSVEQMLRLFKRRSRHVALSQGNWRNGQDEPICGLLAQPRSSRIQSGVSVRSNFSANADLSAMPMRSAGRCCTSRCGAHPEALLPEKHACWSWCSLLQQILVLSKPSNRHFSQRPSMLQHQRPHMGALP